MSIKGRVTKLETRGSPGLFPLPNTGDLGQFSDDQLAYVITGDPKIKASDLTEEYLCRIANVGYAGLVLLNRSHAAPLSRRIVLVRNRCPPDPLGNTYGSD